MSKRILLVDPYFKEGLKGFPLGLAYVAGALREAGHDVGVIDLTARAYTEKRAPKSLLTEKLEKFSPEIVGISSTSPTHLSAVEAARIVKGWKNIPVIKGGPHETNCARTTLKFHPEVNYSVEGEGENTAVDLVGAIEHERDLRSVRGIHFRSHKRGIEEILTNPIAIPIKDLDKLPRPARDLFYINPALTRFYSANLFGGKKSTSIMTSRGCPYSCSFCSSKAGWGNIRFRSAENVAEELRELKAQGFEAFQFEDDMFLADERLFVELADAMTPLGIQYSCQTRVDAINDLTARKLKESGCSLVYFGLESGVQRILDQCGKGITLEQARKAFETTRKHKVRNMASVQFGLPGEDLDHLSTVKETIRVIDEDLRPEEVAVSYTCLYPGSPLARQEGVTPEMYERIMRTEADPKIYDRTAHGTHSIHPRELTPRKIAEIEGVLEKELKTPRFKVSIFYKT